MEATQPRSIVAESAVCGPRGRRIPEGYCGSNFKRPTRCCFRSSVLQSKVESSLARWSKRRSLRSDCGKRQSEAVVPRRGLYGRTTRISSCSDCDVGPYRSGESLIHQRGSLIDSIKEGISVLIGRSPNTSTFKTVESELIVLSVPAMVGQAIEPLSQLLETAYVGRLGPLELASVGVSVSIFNIISKLFNIPLLSVTTSFVAADIAKSSEMDPFGDLVAEKKQLPSVSTAILLAAIIGTVEAVALYVGAGSFLTLMGIPVDSPMRAPSQHFLSQRALGAPAVVVSLAIQGVFRGFKDTKTPLLCTGIGNLAAVFLFPLFMYSLGLGISGAAASVVVSQYIITVLLIWLLNKKVILLPPKMQDLQFDGYMKSGGLLLGRTLSVLVTMTLGTAMAARQGPVAMAAHQICLQVWLAVSLLTDALSLSGQAMIASAFPKGEYKKVKDIAYCVLKTGLFAGVSLAVILCASFGSIAKLFTKDFEVLEIVGSVALFVGVSQPVNALAFVFDGLHYGISDFQYAAFSMMTAAAISSVVLLYAPSIFGLHGVWLGLSALMGLRMAAGAFRLGSKTGPWWFLWTDFQKNEFSASSLLN
ncbi:unnamed protein product [Victoria cruziana]